MLTFFTGTFILSIIVAFVYGWDLTLVILSMMLWLPCGERLLYAGTERAAKMA